MKNYLKKAIVVFIGFLTILLIFEIALRIVGFTHHEQGYAKRSTTEDIKYDYKILTVGDSFTRGLGAPAGNDFSTQLELMLNKNSSKSFKVINGGYAGSNSTQILKKVKPEIDAIKPDMIILLFGGANTWNLWGMETTQDGGSWLSNMLYRIRVFKLIKLFINDIKNKAISGGLDKEKNYLEPIKIEAARRRFEEKIQKNPNNGETYYKMGEFYMREREIEQAIKIFKKGIEIDPKSENNYVGLGAAYQMQGKIEKGIKQMKKGLDVNPRNLNYYNQICTFYNYLGNFDEQIKWAKKAIQINHRCNNFYHFLQGRLPEKIVAQRAAEIDSFLQIYPRSNSQYEAKLEHPCFYTSSIVEIKIQYDKNVKKILNWVESDIKKAIEICRERNIKLIIQNYPLRFQNNFWVQSVTPINELIERVAAKHSIPFVDNKKKFDNLGERQKEYLEPLGCGEHCNAKGYALMANNLYNKILEIGALGLNK